MSLRVVPLFTLTLVASSALVACSSPTVGDTFDQPAPISTLEFLNKNYPVLKAPPTITPAEIAVGENVTIKVETPAGAKRVWSVGAVGEGGNNASLEAGDGGFRLQPGSLATVVPDTYVPAIGFSTMTAEEEAAQGKLDEANQPSAFRQTVFYNYDPARSKTHYVVSASCTGGVYEEHRCGFGYRGTTEDKYKAELAAGVVSDLPIAAFKVTAAQHNFSAAITGVAAASASSIVIYFDVTNHGATAQTVKVGVWANKTASPVAGVSPSTWWDQPIAAGETVHLSSTEYLNYVSSQSYTQYVFVDWDGAFDEVDETDNIGSNVWTAP